MAPGRWSARCHATAGVNMPSALLTCPEKAHARGAHDRSRRSEVPPLAGLPDPQVTGEHDARVRVRRLHQPGRLQARLRRDGRRVAARRPGLARCPGWWTAPARPWPRVRPGGEVCFCDGGSGPTPPAPARNSRSSRAVPGPREPVSLPDHIRLVQYRRHRPDRRLQQPDRPVSTSASPITTPGAGRDQHPVRYRTRPRTGRSVPPDRNEPVIFQEARIKRSARSRPKNLVTLGNLAPVAATAHRTA